MTETLRARLERMIVEAQAWRANHPNRPTWDSNVNHWFDPDASEAFARAMLDKSFRDA